MLNDKHVLIDYCEMVVDRLILQYKEYIFLADQIKQLENSKFTEILKGNNYAKTKLIDTTIAILTTDLNQVSNEMTFANPIVWMMYKYKAYKDTSSEISTVIDFRRHCEPQGYICTLRYIFLRKYVKKHYLIDISDTSIFPDRMDLSEFYLSDVLCSLSTNNGFLVLWKKNEYLITDNKVNKWNSNNI